MYTVIWMEKGQDKWDRLKTKKEVLDKLQEIERTPEACPVGDVWIFHPKADEYASAGNEFIKKERKYEH